MSHETPVGKFLNETNWTPVVPGLLNNFDDAERPDSELLEEGVEHRNEYYHENVVIYRKLGLPRGQKEVNGEENDTDAGCFAGTIVGDIFEGYDAFKNLYKDGEFSSDHLWAGIYQAIAVGVDSVDIGKMIKSGNVLDPFGFIGGQIMGWMLEHVEPLRKSLESLAGNPDMVKAYSQSWGNIAERLKQVAQAWESEVKAGTASWTGATGDAYRKKTGELVTDIGGLATLAAVLAVVNEEMADVVDAVRGAIADILSSLAGLLLEMTIIVLASGGTAGAGMIARVLFEISAAGRRISGVLLELVKTLLGLTGLIDDAVKAVRAVRQVEAAVR